MHGATLMVLFRTRRKEHGTLLTCDGSHQNAQTRTILSFFRRRTSIFHESNHCLVCKQVSNRCRVDTNCERKSRILPQGSLLLPYRYSLFSALIVFSILFIFLHLFPFSYFLFFCTYFLFHTFSFPYFSFFRDYFLNLSARLV